MIQGEFVSKRRPWWLANAGLLLREKMCADYARGSVQPLVDGWQVRFPETEVLIGFRIEVKTRRMAGESLLPMLYSVQSHDACLDAGLVVLKALQQARLASLSFNFFSNLYQQVRAMKVRVRESRAFSSLLTGAQGRELSRLVAAYRSDSGRRKVLIHGDLQASHVIVDVPGQSVGLIDLEAMRIGRPATNFAQLWEAFHYADPQLARRFYRLYLERCAGFVDEYFDTDVKAELALRCYKHLVDSRRVPNRVLESRAGELMSRLLSAASFEEVCMREGERDGDSESLH